MEQYIDKAAIVAEIRKLKDTIPYYSTLAEKDAYKEGIEDAIDKIYSLEVKEADLDFMLHEYWNISPKICVDCLESATMTKDEMINFAKHFFELGLKAQEECHYLTFKDAEKSIVNQARKELCDIKTQKGGKV